ncbi:ATP phosphoribosyltransferase regulatory subunit [Erysipelotrichaceae bacterium AF15-26LB]|nr:putative ATP phosphoribosyltransferase, regulatory subunit [Erysipelotrichaceae bacterium 3_1_53]MCR0347928.1 ATP phosphoribosyltransferase regulatory subunit [[Clostridium] innocuum]RJV90052.1 ATP phosphoribosyltransferase regulatory subunit [Erysipelotrichaceae bacterium AF15-26LB]RJV93323.1 ATP phosphoribosyltransferase regulatory subunit [Erysipelotrichaceae bacterium AF19-24AC]
MKKFAIPEGTRDLILGECTAKKRLQDAIEQVFDSYGYKEIVTPSIEFYQTYQTGFEQIHDEQMYKFFDHNGGILTLRMDMTVPIARVAATKFKDQKPPLRFRYCANVYKVKESFAGKRNEVTDCGIELLGLDEKQSDLEILVCALEVMECMKQASFTLEIGNVNFFHTAVELLGLTKDETQILADLIDRKSLTELKEYLETLRLDAVDKQFFLQLPWLCGSADMLQEALGFCFDARLKAIVENLQLLYEQLSALGYGDRITFDLGKLPHLNYYSGILFEGFVEGIGTSVLSGGRYDSLLEKFGEALPAIGFSIKLDAVLPVLHLKQQEATLTLCYPYEKKVEALRQAKELRKSTRVELLCGDYDDIIVKGENVA